MAKVNVLKQMSEFDFNSPMDVTMIFDESDDDESLKNTSHEQECNKNEVTSPKKRKTACIKINKASKHQKTDDLNKSINLDKNSDNHENNTVLEDISNKKSYKTLQETENAKRSHVNISEENRETTEINEDRAPVRNNQTCDDEPVNTFIEDLLNQLSEHLIIIMKSFYHYGLRKNTCNRLSATDVHKREKVYHLIKYYFFELSYTTVKSIILPQEHNISFINQFIENTVSLANKKHLNWKLNKRHLQPFFNELMKWVKQKTDHNKQNNNQQSNKYMVLKRYLSRPFIHPPHSNDAPQSNYAPNPNVQKNLCLFSSGTPGSEISINIDADTFMNCTQRQYTDCIERPRNQLNNNESAPIARNTVENNVNTIQRNNTNYYRAPPPYHMIPNSKTYYHNPNHSIVAPILKYRTSAQPYQTHQNILQTHQNYQSHVQRASNNETSLTDNNYVNYLSQDNINNNNQMLRTQTDKQMIVQPVITNVSSLNPTCMSVRSVRCCMCGKTTTITCSYNSPSRPSYCSYLCQELDSQVHLAQATSSNS